MSKWVRQGIRTGVKTTRYPVDSESAPGVSPGLPVGSNMPEADASLLANRCPTEAITRDADSLVLDYRRCIHCFRCQRGVPIPAAWDQSYEWATANASDDRLRNFGSEFRRSIHIRVVDAGDCGACLHEVKQLNNPYYNMHRLGFFITPTPRHADVLLVVGPVTDHMRVPLQKTYEAMPGPKRVVAVGACALSGGIFGPSFVSEGGVAQVIPVDVEVPGQPPPPLAILHGLLVAVGRKPPVSLIAPAPALPDKKVTAP
jgi:Ni,Fe-hydrogenase III small subunit/ferredoxin-like protein FixX